nr:hypothetical protein [Tanacetum cinerariifolium]GEX50190.1 hypothetical protein [Tanacetum cinerariifolium]
MSAITCIKCALTWKAFDAFCAKYHIPEEVHPVLPNQSDTIHERPARKIGLYTRFFYYANFRLPLSSFLVDVLRHFRINISQLCVIGAAKVSHVEILCRVYENGHFFWVDSFACPTLFLWHTAKNVTKDPAPVAADFNAQDYATLVAHPSPFRKFIEEFMCLVGLSRHYTLDEKTYPRFLHKNETDMDLFAFIHTPNPTKVKVVERKRVENEPLLLQTTVGHTVPLLLVALDRAESELEASVDKLFDEGGNGNQTDQGGSAGSGRGADVQLVSEATYTVAEDVAPLQPRRQRKRKTMVVDAGEASHPLKKSREDHETPSGPSVTGKSKPVVQRLLAKAVLKLMSRVRLFLHSSQHSGANVAGAEVDSLVKSSIPVMTAVTTVTSTVDPVLVVNEKHVKPSLFSADSSSAGGADPNTGVFLDLSGSDFLVGGIRTVINPDTDLQMTYVPEWSVTNGSRLNDGRVCREMVDEFVPLKFSAMCAEYNVKERRMLKSVVEKKDEVLNVREREIKDLKAQMMLKEAEAAAAIRLRAKASNFKIVEKSLRDEVNALKERNTILEKERNALDVNEVNDKFDELYADFIKIALHLEEKFYFHLLTTISNRRWLLTHGIELAITKCLHSPEYLSALGAVIGKAIEKGMQNGLSARITYGAEGRALTDVAASNKDASVDTLMNILRLEETLAERLGLTELQPHVDQLMVPIHHSPEKVVVGATALSLALYASNIRVRKIRENIAGQRSTLRDVFFPLSEPFSVEVLTGAKGTSDTMLAATVTTTALSTTLASASTIAPISVDDYEVSGTNDQAGTDGNADPFPNVDDAELNIP